jgi:phosphoenolpyruvate phosphomutase
LFAAEAEMENPFVFLYGDIVFDADILAKLLRAPGDVKIVVDRAWYDAHRSGSYQQTSPPDLVITDSAPQTGYRFVPDGTRQRATAVGPAPVVAADEAHGEFIGMAMFSQEGARQLRAMYHRLQREAALGTGTAGARSLDRATVPQMLQAMIDAGTRVDVVNIYKGWTEVDTFDDYRRAWAQVE